MAFGDYKAGNVMFSDGTILAAGQQSAAASLPVVLPAAQITSLTAPVLGAGELHVGQVGGHAATPSANFTRPADTTAYASGDLVANSVTAGSVTPLSWTAARVAAGSGCVRRARLKKSGTTVTNASFRLHLYAASPTLTNGDNGAWLSTQSTYMGAIDLDMSGTSGRVFSDAAEVVGVPVVGSEITFSLGSGQTIYGLLEARAAYTPANAEVFTCELEVFQN